MIGVARVVDGRVPELQDVPDPAVRLRVHVQALLDDVVGGNRLPLDPRRLDGVAWGHRLHVAGEVGGDVCWGDDLSVRPS